MNASLPNEVQLIESRTVISMKPQTIKSSKNS